MRKILVMMALWMAVSIPSGAQVTLEKCQSLAREHYPEVAQYDLISLSENYNISNAARSWIPQITLSGQATYQNAVATFPEQFSSMIALQGVELSGLAKDQYKIALDVNQTIWDGGASKANKAIAKAEAQEQRLTSDVNIYALNQRVNDLYFGMLLLDENYSTCESKREVLDRNYAKIESMCRNGLASKSDLNLIKVEQLQLEQVMDQNRASYDSYRRMLEALTGENLSGKKLVRPSEIGTLPVANNRPELKMIDAKMATLEAKDEALNVSLTPKLSAFVQSYYGNPGLDMFASMASRDWTWNAIVGFRVQWNLSSLFTYQGDKRRLDNSRRMLTVQKDIIEFNSNLQAMQENGDILRIRRAIENDQQIVDLRSDIRSAAESQLSNGVADTANLIRRISEETEAINTRNIHEIELLKMEYELKHTLN